jgi:AraC-like DNA-binding protein
MTFTTTGQSAANDGALHASGQITYDDVAAYMDSTRYLDLSGTSRQVRPTLPFARGSYWMEQVRPDVHVTGCDLEYLNEERVVGCYRPSLFVGMLSAGEHTGFVGGRSIASQRVGVPTLLGVGREVEITSGQRRGQICRMNGFHIGADFLRGLAENGPAGGAGLASVLDGGFAFHELEHSVALRVLLGQLADNPYSGALGQIYAESRILSALVELAALLHDANDSAIPALSRTHRDRAEQARLLLDARLADPPSVPELARTIGLNETDLRRSFKAAFGTTIIDYLRDRRLEIARMLVRQRQLPVATIAYRVGFASPANFATAYRRRFGRPPSRDF